ARFRWNAFSCLAPSRNGRGHVYTARMPLAEIALAQDDFVLPFRLCVLLTWEEGRTLTEILPHGVRIQCNAHLFEVSRDLRGYGTLERVRVVPISLNRHPDDKFKK